MRIINSSQPYLDIKIVFYDEKIESEDAYLEREAFFRPVFKLNPDYLSYVRISTLNQAEVLKACFLQLGYMEYIFTILSKLWLKLSSIS